MSRCDPIGRAQIAARANGDGLLAEGEVQRPGHVALAVLLEHDLLEPSAEHHCRVPCGECLLCLGHEFSSELSRRDFRRDYESERASIMRSVVASLRSIEGCPPGLREGIASVSA